MVSSEVLQERLGALTLRRRKVCGETGFVHLSKARGVRPLSGRGSDPRGDPPAGAGRHITKSEDGASPWGGVDG